MAGEKDDWLARSELAGLLPKPGPLSEFARRYHFIDALLSATTVETCPCCGQEVVKPAPLISREDALRMLEPPDATEP
jgi:hypothetical protein